MRLIVATEGFFKAPILYFHLIISYKFLSDVHIHLLMSWYKPTSAYIY